MIGALLTLMSVLVYDFEPQVRAGEFELFTTPYCNQCTVCLPTDISISSNKNPLVQALVKLSANIWFFIMRRFMPHVCLLYSCTVDNGSCMCIKQASLTVMSSHFLPTYLLPGWLENMASLVALDCHAFTGWLSGQRPDIILISLFDHILVQYVKINTFES